MGNEKLISHIEKHLRHIEDRKTGGFEWDKNNAEVYRIALAALNSQQQRSLDHRELLLLSADQVQREYAEALGCAGDNESILEAIDDMKKRIAELETVRGDLRKTMAAIHNTIRVDGVNTSLASIMGIAKRAYDESSATAGIQVIEGEQKNG